MNLILLRGQVPQDRNPKEIIWDNIDRCDDLYTQMAFRLTDERTEVLYWGGNRKFQPIPPFTEKYVKSISKYRPSFKPDVIIARGGFEEYIPFLKKYPDAIKIYHGAGKRWRPKDGINYDIILCDTKKQREYLARKGENPIMWSKPACSLFETFCYSAVEKEYDICYIANGTQAKIKGVKWVYKTLPSKHRMLHLGNNPKGRKAFNIKRKRVLRNEMPEMISKCKIGILPYTDYDSAPRALPEMLSCNLPVVSLEGVNFNQKENPDVIVATKETFWHEVDSLLNDSSHLNPRFNYFNNSSLDHNVTFLRTLINEIRRRR